VTYGGEGQASHLHQKMAHDDDDNDDDDIIIVY